ncbi:MAG TPA: hypothetical protein VNZ94_00600 [Xanthobacteraceae bacterium]|nr:hypothetical protein [Xanthobacteraceae bacterium]
MRPLHLGSELPGQFDKWVRDSLREIENASYEDISEVADSFTISGDLPETRALNLASPSIDNIAAVLATFISDMKKRGAKRDG